MATGDSLSTIKAKMEALKKLQGEIQKLYALESSINELQFKQLEALEKQESKIVAQIKSQAALNNSIKKQLQNFDEMDDTMASIGNQIKKNSKFVTQQEIAFEAVKIVSESITQELKNGATANEKTQKQIIAANSAYKHMHSSIAEINKEYALGKISNEERVASIQRQSESFKETISLIDMTTVSSEELKGVLEGMGNEANSFSEAMKQTKVQSEQLDAVMSNFSGIPAMSEINNLLKTNIRDTVAWKAAIFAVGAALGKAAYDYFGAPIKAAMQSDKERAQNQIDVTRDVAKIQSNSQFIPSKIAEERVKNEIEGAETIRKLNIDAQYAGQKAAIQFSSSMQMGAAQFQRAAKTALFGKGIGSVGYGAAQMQLVGISADKVASAMESAGAATGKMPSAKIGADMAIMAERTGASVENISSINEMFQRIDGASESSAMNMQEGLRAMADQAGIGLGELTREMAEASKDMLSYQIKSGPALAKQVAYAKSLGVSFNDIAKAGKSMVLNYKDSIKAEMSLSSMLGKNVDLSEVRAKFMEGDQEGAMQALKAQGLDPSTMNMFQQEQLSQALGGMDLSSLSKIFQNTGKNVDLKAGNANVGNQEFLSRTQSAEAALASKQASISADTAIIDAKLSKAIGDAYLADPKYADYLKAQNTAEMQATLLAASMEDAWKATDAYKKSLSDTTQLDFASDLKSTLMGGLSSVLGGIGTTLLSGGAGGLLGKVKGIFSKKGETPSVTPTSDSTVISPITSVAAAGADALVPGAGGVVKSITSQVEAVEEPLEKVMTLGEKLKDFGKGIGSFLKSIGTGVGSAIKAVLQGIGQGLISVSTGLVALTPAIPVMLAFGAAVLLTTPALMALAPVVIKIAEVIGTVLVEALKQAGPIITSIFNGIGTVIGSIGNAIATVITSIATSISMFAVMDAGNLLFVAGGVTALATAVALFGGANILGAVGKFFGGSVFDDLKDISNYASPIQMTADAVWSLANAFGQLSSIDVGKLNNVPWGDMRDFASEGGKFVLASSGGGSFALSKQTTTNIDKMARKTEESFKELKYNSDIQNKMVGVLVANLAALQQIATNTAGDKQINLDGSKVNKKLLANIQTSFGIART
jgi:histidinol phosphatase-like enzyme